MSHRTSRTDVSFVWNIQHFLRFLTKYAGYAIHACIKGLKSITLHQSFGEHSTCITSQISSLQHELNINMVINLKKDNIDLSIFWMYIVIWEKNVFTLSKLVKTVNTSDKKRNIWSNIFGHWRREFSFFCAQWRACTSWVDRLLLIIITARNNKGQRTKQKVKLTMVL